MSTVSETHEAIISISSAQHSDVLQQPVWHFKEVPNRKAPEQNDKQDLRAENSKEKRLFGQGGKEDRKGGSHFQIQEDNEKAEASHSHQKHIKE